MKIGETIRQGDVLLMRVADGTIPAGARPVARDQGRVVLEWGESTGHSHAVAEPAAVLLESGTAEAVERWLRVGAGGATLVHEEHGSIVLEPGTYRQAWPFEYVSDEELRRDLD